MYVHVLMCSRLKRNYSDLYIVDVIDCLSVCQTLTSRSNDYQGVKKKQPQHTLFHTDMYVNSIETNTTSHGKGIEPQILKETVATALVEGNNILGKRINIFRY